MSLPARPYRRMRRFVDRVWTIEAWIEHSEVLREDDRRAVELAHVEYSRRLDDLNHEAARLAARDHLYVSVEKFETFVANIEATRQAFERRYADAHAALSDRINDLASQQKGAAATWGKILTLASILIAATTAIVLIVHP